MRMTQKMTFVLLSALILLVLFCWDQVYPQDSKQSQKTLSVPEIILPDVNILLALETIKPDTATIKSQLEQITAKRKELAEFERHFKNLLKLERQKNSTGKARGQNK